MDVFGSLIDFTTITLKTVLRQDLETLPHPIVIHTVVNMNDITNSMRIVANLGYIPYGPLWKYSPSGETVQSSENPGKEYHGFWLRLSHAGILISNVPTSA